jgi:hypothetical protein
VSLAEAHYAAEEWTASHRLWTELEAENPGDENALGWLGVLAARRGGHDLARRISNQLGEIEGPDRYGRRAYQRARIAAVLGETAEAVTLLQDAFSQGDAYGIWIHLDMDLDSLRDDPAFQELVRPKG